MREVGSGSFSNFATSRTVVSRRYILFILLNFPVSPFVLPVQTTISVRSVSNRRRAARPLDDTASRRFFGRAAVRRGFSAAFVFPSIRSLVQAPPSVRAAPFPSTRPAAFFAFSFRARRRPRRTVRSRFPKTKNDGSVLKSAVFAATSPDGFGTTRLDATPIKRRNPLPRRRLRAASSKRFVDENSPTKGKIVPNLDTNLIGLIA